MQCSCCTPSKIFASYKALNGHISNIKGKVIRQEKYDNRIQQYLVDPVLCKACATPLSYNDAQSKKAFCNSSCSATFNNVRRQTTKTYVVINQNKRKVRRHKELQQCLGCNAACSRQFCSPTCSTSYRWIQNTLPRILKGMVHHRPTLKRYLIQTSKHQCSDCKSTIWKNNPIPLELDHIDGNATNNNLINLRLLCPNCHSCTPTYKARNKGFGRKSRGLKSC